MDSKHVFGTSDGDPDGFVDRNVCKVHIVIRLTKFQAPLRVQREIAVGLEVFESNFISGPENARYVHSQER